MTHDRPGRAPTARAALVGISAVYIALSVFGITWGLPSRDIDKYLFGGDPPWPGEKIYRLADGEGKFAPTRGADVDIDPLRDRTGEPVPLTATPEGAARIYLRYRLYTYQPDEMITMMALAGMKPGQFNFDPRLYQYGGLFLYPVGALIRICGALNLVDVRPDVAFYLDHPGEFGKFYMVARAYAAAWGLVGVWVIFAIARRLAGTGAGCLAALLFTLMPVVVCMAHEGKPHLPGAALMLLAVLLAMRHLDRADRSTRRAGAYPRAAGSSLRDASNPEGGSRSAVDSRGPKPTARSDWWLMCGCCGAAAGMVINTWPIFILIPLVAWCRSRRAADFSLRDVPNVEGGPRSAAGSRGLKPAAQVTALGSLVALAVYFVTNPYVLLNVFINREVLRSNFGNSLAMYEIARVHEGLIRVLQLTVEGATLPVVLLGVTAVVLACVRSGIRTSPAMDSVAALAVPAALFFLQFVLIGAGKPAEYGRFGIFTNTALAIGTACILAPRGQRGHAYLRWAAITLVVVWGGLRGGAYLRNFYLDAATGGSRIRLARRIAETEDPSRVIGVTAEPAPYSCPPLDFARRKVVLVSSPAQLQRAAGGRPALLLQTVDRTGGSWGDTLHQTPISWANKPFGVRPPSDR